MILLTSQCLLFRRFKKLKPKKKDEFVNKKKKLKIFSSFVEEKNLNPQLWQSN